MANAANEKDTLRDGVLALYRATRARTESLAERLSPEDQQIQSMPDASPAKWHRAHTTWFFETFVLAPMGVEVVDARYGYVFNSYYDSVGPRHGRPSRGLLSRPTAAEVGAYRSRVDEQILRFIAGADAAALDRMLPVLELGIAHEEQHQELMLTDILHAFSLNPLEPAFLTEPRAPVSVEDASELRFISFDGGLREIGAPTGPVFAFDNEQPRHKEWLEPFALADRLVTVAELKAFIEAGGYRTPSLWLSDGFDAVRAQGTSTPLYSRYEDGHFDVFTLAGRRAPRPEEPASHLSYYEADAVARFLGARLPTEAEWELAAAAQPVRGNFAEDGVLRPLPRQRDRSSSSRLAQLFGDAWEWTSTSYGPYPGYEAPAGALGEYNGKFMVSQVVLRGGSCLTPRRHVRASYRNFWYPRTQFQMTGVRLARSVS
jgi:ergothioneine biosynthesis protein EgtB